MVRMLTVKAQNTGSRIKNGLLLSMRLCLLIANIVHTIDFAPAEMRKINLLLEIGKEECDVEQKKLCLNAYELSLKTGLSLSFIRKLTREGKLPYLRVGRRVLYPITGVEEWLAKNMDAEKDEL
jgi:excisionase family DNA binding protein